MHRNNADQYILESVGHNERASDVSLTRTRSLANVFGAKGAVGVQNEVGNASRIASGSLVAAV